MKLFLLVFWEGDHSCRKLRLRMTIFKVPICKIDALETSHNKTRNRQWLGKQTCTYIYLLRFTQSGPSFGSCGVLVRIELTILGMFNWLGAFCWNELKIELIAVIIMCYNSLENLAFIYEVGSKKFSAWPRMDSKYIDTWLFGQILSSSLVENISTSLIYTK